jgi:hypothetical protein
MRLLRIGVTGLLMASLTSPAFAGDLQASAAKAVDAQVAMTPLTRSHSAKTTMIAGSALFVGGFVVGVYGFLDNKNGKYAEFGEASARNVHLGAAGLGAAFAGGALLFMGSRAKHLPSVSAGAGSVSVAKQVSW